MDSLENPKHQQYKAYLCAFSNPVLNFPNRQLWTEQILPNFELIVVNEIRETDTTIYADYVLPEAPVMERLELACAPYDCIVLMEPATPPQGEARNSADLWKGLADTIGIGEYFDKTEEDWARLKLENQPPPLANVSPPITMERLKEEKIIALDLPEDINDEAWASMKFNTYSGRIEFYSEELTNIGFPMATFEPAFIHDKEMTEEYPLQFFPGRSRFFMQGQFTEVSELRELAGKVSTVALNPQTAAEKGIKKGDLIEVFNHRGSCQAVAHISRAFPPGVAHMWYPYSAKEYLSDPPTALSPAMGTAETCDQYSTFLADLRVREETELFGVPEQLLLPVMSNSNESYWDARCDVRKL
ncbi:MAG: molybdopterin-dependent oxidoreductase [Coriobacteriales bacterium]|jgi:anaerobic selenocysteine-containing dehydrogenase|nr:molybdopterin-dependent oxidoreductase [Coriobacteriales bacterium]